MFRNVAKHFFTDRRIVGEVELSYLGGKAKLSCTLSEEWEDVLSRQVRCGASFTKTISKKHGVEKAEVVSLESSLTSSIGIGLAKLASELKGALQTEVRMTEATETTEQLKFEAPKCGRYSALVYQLHRRWHFQFKDDRFLHRSSWTKTLSEATPYYHDASKMTTNDPDCGCSAKPEAGIDGQLFLDAGHVGIVAGFIAGNDRLAFPRLHHEFSGEFLKSKEPGVTLDPARLPGYLRFFLAAKKPLFVTVARYVETWHEMQPQQGVQVKEKGAYATLKEAEAKLKNIQELRGFVARPRKDRKDVLLE